MCHCQEPYIPLSTATCTTANSHMYHCQEPYIPLSTASCTTANGHMSTYLYCCGQSRVPPWTDESTTVNSYKYHHHCHDNHLTAIFRDHPGKPVPEENFWTLWCKERLTEADTPTIRLGATPSGQTSAHLHHPPLLFTGQMNFLPLNQQRQSTEGN